MVWQELKAYAVDGLFVLGGVVVGGPMMALMAGLFCGIL